MDNNKKHFNYPFRYFLIHIILTPISYTFGILNFTIILCLKYRSFFISSFIIQVLVIIFMIKLLCLFKTKFDSTDNIKCTLIIYSFLSFIALIMVSIEYTLIFQNINLPKSQMDKKYKISFICISILYHIYHNLNFIYEFYIVIREIKKYLDDRVDAQISERRNAQNKNKNETQSSEKPKKNESFIKEDTIYIIHGKINDNSIQSDNIKENACNIKNNNNSERKLNQEDNKEVKNNNENKNISKESYINSKFKINISNLKLDD